MRENPPNDLLARIQNLTKLGPSKPKSASWWAWLVILLLPLALLIPLRAEEFQRHHIGEEELCCALSTMPEYVEKAEFAKSLRPVSNFIIGGSLIAALVVAVVATWVLICCALPCIRIRIIKIFAVIFLAIISSATITILTYTAEFFFTDTDSYYRLRARPPEDGIYSTVKLRDWYRENEEWLKSV